MLQRLKMTPEIEAKIRKAWDKSVDEQTKRAFGVQTGGIELPCRCPMCHKPKLPLTYGVVSLDPIA